MKFISTSGHGYLKITRKKLAVAIDKGYKPSVYSFYNDKIALLEEDSDLGKYLEVMGIENPNFNITYVNDINRNCYERFSFE